MAFEAIRIKLIGRNKKSKIFYYTNQFLFRVQKIFDLFCVLRYNLLNYKVSQEIIIKDIFYI